MMTSTFLFFDLDHTLLDFDAAEEVALSKLFEELGVLDLPAYKAAYRQINQQLWRDLEQGLVTKQELVTSRFARTFAQFGQTASGADLATRYEIWLGQQGQTYPGARALLLTLNNRGYRLFAATNGIQAIQTRRLQASGLADCFEQVFISETLGYAKPDSRFFGTMAQQIAGFLPDQAVMIGDNQLADIQGAGAFGLKTIWYNPKGLPLRQGVSPTAQVGTYEELLALLP